MRQSGQTHSAGWKFNYSDGTLPLLLLMLQLMTIMFVRRQNVLKQWLLTRKLSWRTERARGPKEEEEEDGGGGVGDSDLMMWL